MKPTLCPVQPHLHEDVRGTWTEYHQTRSETLRNQLIEYYLPLVTKVARRLQTNLPKSVSLEDLESHGSLGLVRAVECFDLDRGIQFNTYCTHRVRGAILDGLRSVDWVPRKLRSQHSSFSRTEEHLTRELGRRPTNQENADALGMDPDSYARKRDACAPRQLVSLSSTVNSGEGEETTELGDLIANNESSNPEALAIRNDTLQKILRVLSEKEKTVLVLYHFDNLKMADIGRVMDLTESRVCQIHNIVIRKLRNQIEILNTRSSC